ncbi:helicase ARIP4 [Ixodes scapularis]
MTPIQRTLYREFVKEFLHNYRATNPLKFFAVCCKVWNHPDILFHLVQDKKSEGALDIDLDIDLLAPPGSKDPMGTRGTGQPGVDPSDNPYPFAAETSGMCARAPKYPPEPAAFREKSDNNISYEWAYPLLEQYQPDQLENSHKFLVLMTILEQTLGVGDKLLVFSQSLSTLDLVERFLGQREVPLRPGLPHGDKWARGRNYFRLDGSTSAQEREKLINEYNANAGVSLFLLSTRAGCLGINLTGANRIVVLDASWNPCHDAQAVCRIYRYGQAKPCHIYRLVCDNCLEKRIYDRQVNKQGMSDRVVDEMNPEANLTWKDVSTLVQDNEDDPPVQDLSASAGGYSDSVLRTLSVEYSQCLTKEPFEHESLLLDRKDLKLTKFEKRLAKQSYELEKRATLHGGRSYVHSAAYTNGYQGWQNRQQGNVTFVGPAQTTPSPLQPASNGDMPIWGSPNVMQSLLRQGMTVQRMRVPAKVTIPLNNSADPPVEIPPGTEILVMKTPKGVYLRIPDGRIIAVRIPGIGEAGPQSSEGTSAGAAAHSGNKQSFGIVQPSLQCGGRVQLSGAAGAACQSRAAPEVINLDDDSDLPDEDSSEEEGAPPPANNGAAAKTPAPGTPPGHLRRRGVSAGGALAPTGHQCWQGTCADGASVLTGHLRRWGASAGKGRRRGSKDNAAPTPTRRQCRQGTDVDGAPTAGCINANLVLSHTGGCRTAANGGLCPASASGGRPPVVAEDRGTFFAECGRPRRATRRRRAQLCAVDRCASAVAVFISGP